MIIDYPWYFVLLCLLAGAIYAAALYGLRPHVFNRRLQWILAVLRFLAVSVVAFLLLEPLMRQTLTERQRPMVLLARDVSGSVRLSADSAFSFSAMEGQLDNCEWVMEDFGSAQSTDISAILSARPGGRKPDAIVLATDGISNRGTNPVTIGEQLSCPVYTVALGDTTPRRDAAIVNLRCNRVAMSGNSFPVNLTLSATHLQGRHSRLSVSDARGKVVYSQAVDYADPLFSTTVSVNVMTDQPGLQRFTVNLQPVEGELYKDNNHAVFYVDVIDSRRKVGIIANAPHPDLAALKRAVESNPNYQATVLLADDMQGSKVRVQDSDYALVILHNLPSERHPSVDFSSSFPQIYVLGTQTDLSRFNALHTGMEIVSRAAGSMNEVTAIRHQDFSLFAMDENDAGRVEQWPPLSAPFGQARLEPHVQTLFGARVGNIDAQQPLLAATSQGAVRRAFVWGEGLWRWRLDDYRSNGSHQTFDRLISSLVSFAAITSSRDRLVVESARCYSDDEVVSLRAQLYNESYELTNIPDVNLSLKGDSAKGDYLFMREDDAYRLSLSDLPAGLYRYRATAVFDGQTLSAEGSFAIEALNLEQRNLVADHALLRSLSAVTGGIMVTPDQLSNLQNSLSALKPTLYTHTRYTDMLHLPWLLALLILLMGLEWFLRKYNGTL